MNASVILPAYNEEKNITYVVRSIKKTGRYEIIVVDDGSKDNTLEAARAEGCVCIRFNKNMGKGFACNAGAKLATRDNLVFMDGDNQLDPAGIRKLLDVLKTCDLAIGRRDMDVIPFNRRLSNLLAKKALSAATGENFGDVLCGFRAIKKDIFLRLDMKEKRYEFESEMLLKAVDNDLKIKEVPITVRYGVGSSMPLPDSARIATYILKEMIHHNYKMLLTRG